MIKLKSNYFSSNYIEKVPTFIWLFKPISVSLEKLIIGFCVKSGFRAKVETSLIYKWNMQ